SNTIATPLFFTIPPEYTTLYPSLSKSPHSFHLTSLIPNTFSPFLFISFFTFSNFPFTFIVLTFHVPILSVPSLVLGSVFHLMTTEGDLSLHLPPPPPPRAPPPP